mmetsp:Transcript_4832/g.12877  ORF Transcript_4832/g.12877 Transcript_4832/m.12877 type:complete len:94 (+) Transcript_4832:158-439(+)
MHCAARWSGGHRSAHAERCLPIFGERPHVHDAVIAACRDHRPAVRRYRANSPMMRNRRLTQRDQCDSGATAGYKGSDVKQPHTDVSTFAFFGI